jgi:hypothetical protein
VFGALLKVVERRLQVQGWPMRATGGLWFWMGQTEVVCQCASDDSDGGKPLS